MHDLAQSLNQGGQCDVLMLDFCQAFDKVPHLCLLQKLHHYGIRGTLFSWIKAFLTNRSQQVIIDNKQSAPTNVLSGVPQGTVLGPLLFSLYINDLPLHVTNKVKLYADDVVLYSNINSLDDCHALQKDLDSLTQWSQTWQMVFNPRKCEFLRVSNKNKHFIPYNYCIADSPIKEVNHVKYLGVMIDQSLTWNEHIKQISNKAIKVLAFLHRNLYNCPPIIKCNCYKTMVCPILEYSSTVWDPHTSVNINILESIQKSAARFCYNTYSRFFSVSAMLNCLSLSTLQSRRNKAKLSTMYKIIHHLVAIPDNCLNPIYSPLRRGYYSQLDTRIDSYKFSFFPSTIKLWNSLPPFVVNSPTYDQFCINLDNYYNHTCAL